MNYSNKLTLLVLVAVLFSGTAFGYGVEKNVSSFEGEWTNTGDSFVNVDRYKFQIQTSINNSRDSYQENWGQIIVRNGTNRSVKCEGHLVAIVQGEDLTVRKEFKPFTIKVIPSKEARHVDLHTSNKTKILAITADEITCGN